MDKIGVIFIALAVLDDNRAGTPLEERYDEGKSYDLDPHTAVRWVKRDKAQFATAADAEAAHAVIGWSRAGSIYSEPGGGDEEPDQANGTDEPGDDGTDFGKMTRAELEAFASEKSIDISTAKNKPAAIEIIVAALTASI
ncbi:hypothetical protein [Aminobacter carboxidus]|uniref:Rho termination factor N-terminal domain-containing protein n=1 Tax=Aminobacter carboxidus TaxID=376165 RepID=A0ABR9GX66_9HYPH|nr:hypothetical protein [Aminobacter carboxidus]MBE1208114.1 hypothetical protein [Aminobacter carboxidus]